MRWGDWFLLKWRTWTWCVVVLSPWLLIQLNMFSSLSICSSMLPRAGFFALCRNGAFWVWGKWACHNWGRLICCMSFLDVSTSVVKLKHSKVAVRFWCVLDAHDVQVTKCVLYCSCYNCLAPKCLVGTHLLSINWDSTIFFWPNLSWRNKVVKLPDQLRCWMQNLIEFLVSPWFEREYWLFLKWKTWTWFVVLPWLLLPRRRSDFSHHLIELGSNMPGGF